MPRLLPSLLCLLSLCTASTVSAQTRAWIDRDRIAAGETTTLNIETDDVTASAPDYTPLQRDFEISANTSSRQVEIVNGHNRSRTLFAVALQPRRDGLLTIPPLQVGAQTTQPLSLTVGAARPTRSGGPVFIEAEADEQSPYVQQSVGYTLRLYYDTPVITGQLDQPAPEGASLQKVGSDLQYGDTVGGKPYTVVERRFLLVPEHSGPLTIPGARFRGRGAGGFFDDMFGDGQRAMSANGAPRLLDVRPVPVNAPQPWLPLRDLSLRYLATPQRVRAGEAVSVVVELHADGAGAAQLPELQLPAVDGAQVFADPPQSDDTFDKGRPQVRLTRKFSIVPARGGALRIPGPRIGWWDTRASVARTASLPDINLRVAAAATTPASARAANAPTPAASTANDGLRIPGVQGRVRPWAFATVVFALLWLVTLAWGLHRRPGVVTSPSAGSTKTPAAPPPPPPQAGLRELKQVLDTGTLGEVADVLCAMARPPVRDADALHARLDDAAQRDAIAQLQRARWSDGDVPAARAALRKAFANGPRWKHAARASKPLLPPLYPEG